MEAIRNILKKLIRWVFIDEDIRFDALVAMDFPMYHKAFGKVIIVTKVNGVDTVKIIDIAPKTDLRTYREMIDRLRQFNVEYMHIDCGLDERARWELLRF